MSVRRRCRFSRGERPRDVRGEALAAARELLLTYGPAGATLTAVAERIARSHSVAVRLIPRFFAADS